jgi:hypothetical protein
MGALPDMIPSAMIPSPFTPPPVLRLKNNQFRLPGEYVKIKKAEVRKQ